MGAVIALRRRMVVRVHINGVIWARLGTGFAADTPPIVKIDNSVRTCKQRRNRTDLYARCISTVIAPHYREQPTRVRKLALLDVLDPRPVNADRHLVLGLARDGAGMAADTLPVIDNKAVVHLIEE